MESEAGDPDWEYGQLVKVGDTGIGLWIPTQHKAFGDYADSKTVEIPEAIGLLVEFDGKGGEVE